MNKITLFLIMALFCPTGFTGDIQYDKESVMREQYWNSFLIDEVICLHNKAFVGLHFNGVRDSAVLLDQMITPCRNILIGANTTYYIKNYYSIGYINHIVREMAKEELRNYPGVVMK